MNISETDEHIRSHKWMRREKGSAKEHRCVDCDSRAMDWSQTHGSDLWNLDSYRPRCRSCHKFYDMTQETKDKMSASKSKWVGGECGWGHDVTVPENMGIERNGLPYCKECRRNSVRAKRAGVSLKEYMRTAQEKKIT